MIRNLAAGSISALFVLIFAVLLENFKLLTFGAITCYFVFFISAWNHKLFHSITKDT